MNLKQILIISILGTTIFASDKPTQDVQPTENLIIKESNVLIKETDDLLKKPEVLKYINEAYSKGFRDGAEESKLVMIKKIERMGQFMDNLFAFHKLYLEGKLEPPKIGVVSEPIQVMKEGKVMIIQQEYMEIIEPAKFVNQPKTWKNFILE